MPTNKGVVVDEDKEPKNSECFEEIVAVVVRRMMPGGDLRDLFELDLNGADIDELWNHANDEGITKEVFAEACLRVAAADESPSPDLRCWECSACKWQVLDPQLDLGAAVCLCGTGAGVWRVGTVRLPSAAVDLPVVGEIRPLGAAELGQATFGLISDLIIQEVADADLLCKTWAVRINGVDVGTIKIDRVILERDGPIAIFHNFSRYLAEFLKPINGGTES